MIDQVEGREVWVAETWKAHGCDHDVQGVYDSREAAFEGLKAAPGMTVYVADDGNVRGRPRNEEWRPRDWLDADPRLWAVARPFKVRGRERTPTATPNGAAPASPPPEPSR
jgi:hypothetical protein